MELTVKVMVDVTPTLQKLCEAFMKINAHQKVTLEASPQPEEKVEEKAEEKKADKPEEITNVALRDAMEEIRKKFEFTDPSKPDVANADIHKALTHQFKEIARELGSDKPTALPQDKREGFLERLGWIKVGEDGAVTCLPF